MAIVSSFKALSDLYKSVGKRLPWTEQELMSGLPKGRAIAPQDLALEAARREAADMGLPSSNTAADRAAAMGHDTTIYHGRSRSAASRGDFTDVLPGVGGTEAGALWAGDKALAGKYTGRQGAVYPLTINRSSLAETGYAMPSESELAAMSPAQVNRLLSDIDDWNEKINAVKPEYVASEIEKATREGKNGAVFRQFLDVPLFATSADFPTDVYALQKGVRSRFAAFNPALKDSSNLLAGIGGAAVGAGALMAPGESEAGIGGVLAKTADVPVAFTAAGRSALFPTKGNSAYSEMMALKRAADAKARTHAGPPTMTPGAQTARTLAIEAMNPASWPLFWGSRELGDPQALGYADPYYSYSGATRR